MNEERVREMHAQAMAMLDEIMLDCARTNADLGRVETMRDLAQMQSKLDMANLECEALAAAVGGIVVSGPTVLSSIRAVVKDRADKIRDRRCSDMAMTDYLDMLAEVGLMRVVCVVSKAQLLAEETVSTERGGGQ